MDYDLVIIGAGWAGFNAAKRAQQLGLKIALVEKDKIGGTCLNRGCIPTKALIQSAKVYNLIKKANNFGVETIEPKANFSKIQLRKQNLVQQLSKGMEFMLKGIDLILGEANFLSSTCLQAGSRKISAKYFLIASGSQSIELKDLRFDGEKIISSDEILNLKEAPKSLLIIGGGVIGCEFASLFSNLGSKVAIVEKMPQLLPGEDNEAARKIEVIFKKKGIIVNTGTDAASCDLNNYSLVLVCVGRSPLTAGLGLEKIGLNFECGRIVTDEFLRTNISNIFASGDCTAGYMLAHFAAYQGRLAAENIANPCNLRKCDNRNVPSCIFTDPEIASVGLKDVSLQVNKFEFLGSGMARILDETEGFIKISSEKNTGRIVSATIIGAQATELIGILSLAIQNRLTINSIKNTIFAHPTLSESIREVFG